MDAQEENPKGMPSLEDLATTGKIGIFLTGVASALILNEVVQQVKHLGYHLKGIPHVRVENMQRRDISEGVFTDMLSSYVPADSGFRRY